MCGSTPSSEQVASRSARLSYFGLTLISVITAWAHQDRAVVGAAPGAVLHALLLLPGVRVDRVRARRLLPPRPDDHLHRVGLRPQRGHHQQGWHGERDGSLAHPDPRPLVPGLRHGDLHDLHWLHVVRRGDRDRRGGGRVRAVPLLQLFQPHHLLLPHAGLVPGDGVDARDGDHALDVRRVFPFVAMDSMYTGPPEMIPAVTIIIAVVMMGYASVTISASKSFSGDGGSPKKGGSNLGPDGMMQEREVPLVSLDQVSVDPASTENTMNNEDDEKTGVQLSGPVGYNIAAFHFAFMLGMCYVGMQLTNWNEDFAKGSVDKGSTSMWIKIADSWILAIAYLWAMVAPKVLSNRSFS
ncbi:serine incorporator-domain-containing protein [Baffinella frigidus]|nr:serine incorporator-domain-containing protein [Cryptophyta sp. CCMP2293]